MKLPFNSRKKNYDHIKIESKWRKKWARAKIYKTKEDDKKPKYYVLDMFPYPSGEGLHVGHPKGYIATDIVSRYKRMKGYSVLHPMGFDAFGLPAENYAIKTKTNPEVSVKKNIVRYKKQLEMLGFDYDWSREINTTDPKYYKWTQWIFLQMFKKGLAYQSYEPINWCPSCKTGLANEDIENGRCERCGTLVDKKPLRQWVLKITDYAERLLQDLDAKDASGKPLLDWPESIKESQRNWIGKSEGAEIGFEITYDLFDTISSQTNRKSRSAKGLLGESVKKDHINVFTTRPDTLFGATYVVLAPEHPLVSQFLETIENKKEVESYIFSIKIKTEVERTDIKKEKTGVELKGIKAINPANKKEIPIWIADYVLPDYGRGAIMAVPACDERDRDFAQKYHLPIVELSEENHFFGTPKITYKLRDWVFSRQRYWGEPIPLIHCKKCGVVAVPEKDLPIKLPKVKHYEPTGTGESPLATIEKWVNVKCPKCGGMGKRETNTMPQWAGSSWYYLRYMDPKNKKSFVDAVKEKIWSPIDLYVGGAEHATRHLIYARFWHKFLFDIGAVSTIEPFKKLQNVGLIMGEDRRKMSKRFGNVINPDDIVRQYGTDTLRVYEMFMGPFEQEISWSTANIIGSRRFIERVWKLRNNVISSASPAGEELLSPRGRGNVKVKKLLHKTIKKVSDDIENLRFNTAVSSMMICLNELEKIDYLGKEEYEIFLKLLAPFAPHVAEELWISLGNKKSIHISPWPVCDDDLVIDEEIVIVVQVNGKVRASFKTIFDTNKDDMELTALNLPEIKKYINGKKVLRVVVVPERLVNIVVSNEIDFNSSQ